MYISRATGQDLPAIQYLLGLYKKMTIEPYHLNKRDIALQARVEDGTLVGFIWAGLMGNGRIGYIDKFVVHPDYTHKQVGLALGRELLKEGQKRGVKECFGLIYHDEFHDKCAISALKHAMGAHAMPYTYIFGSVSEMVKEIEKLGV